MQFKCTNCQKALRVADEHAGKQIRCPSCATPLQVPIEARPIAKPPASSMRAPASSVRGERRASQRSAADPFASPLPHEGAGIATPPPGTTDWTAPDPPSLAGAAQARGRKLGAATAKATMWSAPQSKNRRHAPLLLWWVLGGLGALFGILLIAGIALILLPTGQADPSLAINTSRPSLAEASTADSGARSSLVFPELGTPETVQGVSVYFVDLARTNRSSQPGAATKLRVYLPPGNPAPRSIPLMLVAPAGTPLLHGNEVDAGDYHDETLPYAQAGFATIMYSLDGAMPENASEAEFAMAISRAYNQFNAAQGGILNAQIAIDFALARLPQVDPQRIYCAGHSSAATISLVLAAKESRIAAGIAYAPATNLELRLSDVIRDPSSNQLLTGIGVFARENSPITYVGQTRCPLFVFHAKDDSNEPFSTTSRYVEMLKQRQADVTFKTADRGDHYQSMIDQGIPAAIDWLRTKQPQLSQTQ